MSELLQSSVNILLGLLESAPSKALPLHALREELEKHIGSETGGRGGRAAAKAIQYALDSWIVEKIIDYPEYSNGNPIGSPVWLLRLLSPEEFQQLKVLSPVEKSLLKLLMECNNPDSLGEMCEDSILSELQKLGFDVDSVSLIEGRTSDFFDPEDDKLVRWWYIIPEYEKAKEYKSMLDGFHERASQNAADQTEGSDEDE